ncbi:MAG: hypothetical protein ACREQP_17840 [Candidatus Binatia bacterium]
MQMNIDDLQVYKVTIRNTGNSPIKELPIRFVFENATDKFSLLAAKHKTNPDKEFGKIDEDFKERGKSTFRLSASKSRG